MMQALEFKPGALEFKIEIVLTPAVSEEYAALRQENWDKAVEAGKNVGKKFHNGVIYRFIGFDEETGTIRLGKMQYADRLLKTKFSPTEIADRYGEDHVMQHCVVNAIIVTSDGKLVVGVKKNSVDLKPGKLAYIGGNLSADEVKVNTFEDISTMMMTEIGEETRIVPQKGQLSFAKLVANGNFASFYFLYQLDIHSEEIDTIFREGEFVQLEAMSIQELIDTDRAGITDLEQSKGWVRDLFDD